VSKDPAAAKSTQQKAAPMSAKVSYVITLNGKEHKVTVAPEK
jgi:hypothetical protein